jgi:hypothetical protein
LQYLHAVRSYFAVEGFEPCRPYLFFGIAVLAGLAPAFWPFDEVAGSPIAVSGLVGFIAVRWSGLVLAGEAVDVAALSLVPVPRALFFDVQPIAGSSNASETKTADPMLRRVIIPRIQGCDRFDSFESICDVILFSPVLSTNCLSD